MRFPQPLKRGVLVRRYKRFLADVVFEDGSEATVHTPNPGAMLGLCDPGMTVFCSKSESITRKLPWTWELVEADGGLVGVNTQCPNALVAEALALGALPRFADYGSVRREVNYGLSSRIDFLLEREAPPVLGQDDGLVNPPLSRLWLEVKNCHLSRTKGLAEFPDCVAARSSKHLRELEAMVAEGDRAAVLFVVQRTDCQAFRACHELDPTFFKGLGRAAEAGVEVYAYACAVELQGVTITSEIPWLR